MYSPMMYKVYCRMACRRSTFVYKIRSCQTAVINIRGDPSMKETKRVGKICIWKHSLCRRLSWIRYTCLSDIFANSLCPKATDTLQLRHLWVSWCLKYPAFPICSDLFFKENTKKSVLSALCEGGFPSQRASNAWSVSMSWRHHESHIYNYPQFE